MGKGIGDSVSSYGAGTEAAEERDDEEQGPSLPSNLERNLVARAGFPHAKVHRFWTACQAYAKKAWAKNEDDFKEALRWYDGENYQDAGDVDRQPNPSKDAKFCGATWFSDTNKLVSFYNGRDATYACASAKGDQWKETAKAAEKLGERITREMDFRSRISLVIFEAICRNHGFLRQTWDHYRWLPGWEYCDGEVRFDPDSNGDIKKAKWIIEEFEIGLDELLEDPEITEEHKRELRDKREIHRETRPEKTPGLKAEEATYEWDSVQGFEKLTAYRIVSSMGVLPASMLRNDRSTIDERDSDANAKQVIGGTAVMPFSEEDFARHTPHMKLTAPAEIPDDAPPQAPPFDPLEHGQRVMLLMVEGFKKILKVVPWPMDHYDRGESPYIEFRLTRPPGSLHGTSIFRAIVGYLKLIDRAITYWVKIERQGGRKLIEYAKDLDPTEAAKIETGGLYEAVPVAEPGRTFHLTEFAPRVTNFKELIPFLQGLHDDNSGINDAVSGTSPDTQETATAAQMRMDQAIASLGYIEAEVQRFMEEVARLTIAAALRYIPRESVFVPCPMCSDEGATRGRGEIPDLSPALEAMEPTGLGPEPMMRCPLCEGNGWEPEAFQARKRIVKGADFWLSEDLAAAWVDNLPVEEIRAEIIVGVRHGSTRRDYRERELARLRSAGQDFVPFYQAIGGPVGIGKWREYVAEVAETTGIETAEKLIPTEQDIAAALEMQQAMSAPPSPPPEVGPSPEVIQEQEMKMAEFAHRRDVEERKVAIDERRQALEEAPHMEALKLFREQIAAMNEQRAAERVEQERQEATATAAMTQVLQAVNALAQTIQTIQASVMPLNTAAAQVSAAAQALQASALVPKRVVRDESGQIIGVEPVVSGAV